MFAVIFMTCDGATQATSLQQLSFNLGTSTFSILLFIFTVHIWKTELSPNQYAIWKEFVSISGAKLILKGNSHFLLTELSVSCCRNCMPVLLKKALFFSTWKNSYDDWWWGAKTHVRYVCISCETAAQGRTIKRGLSVFFKGDKHIVGSQEQDKECFPICPCNVRDDVTYSLRESWGNCCFLSRLNQSRTWSRCSPQTSTHAWTCQAVLTVMWQTLKVCVCGGGDYSLFDSEHYI